MIKILMVCHGNICRSPMAEWIMKKRLSDLGQAEQYEIRSAATSREEIGNDLYPPAKEVLRKHGIPFSSHSARQLCSKDYNYFDYLICMDDQNVRNAIRFFSGDPDSKIRCLMNKPVADPWYTGDFDTTYRDLQEGIDVLINSLSRN